MEAEIERLLESLWPEWKVTGFIESEQSVDIYRIRRNDIVNTYERALAVITIPSDERELNKLKDEGFRGEELSLYLRSMVEDKTKKIRLMLAVSSYTHIVSLEDYQVVQDDQHTKWYILLRMELLMSLPRRLHLGAMHEEDIIQMGIDLCSALEVLGQKGIIHHNINAHAIYVSSSGEYKLGNLLDAAYWKEKDTTFTFGEASSYAAPELLQDGNITRDFSAGHKANLYSLGLVMYYLANHGKMPFLPADKQICSSADRRNAFTCRVNGDPLPPIAGISERLQQIIKKACAFEPMERYHTAADMRNDLLALRSVRETKQTIQKRSEHKKQDQRPVKPTTFLLSTMEPKEATRKE